MIIVGTAVNASVNIPASGPGDVGDIESTKQRRNLVHTRHMGINKDVWQLPQVKEEEDHESYRIFDSDCHFEQQYPLSRKLTMDLKKNDMKSGTNRSHSRLGRMYADARGKCRQVASKNNTHYYHGVTGRMTG